jgi:hypothetical protein
VSFMDRLLHLLHLQHARLIILRCHHHTREVITVCDSSTSSSYFLLPRVFRVTFIRATRTTVSRTPVPPQCSQQGRRPPSHALRARHREPAQGQQFFVHGGAADQTSWEDEKRRFGN